MTAVTIGRRPPRLALLIGLAIVGLTLVAIPVLAKSGGQSTSRGRGRQRPASTT